MVSTVLWRVKSAQSGHAAFVVVGEFREDSELQNGGESAEVAVRVEGKEMSGVGEQSTGQDHDVQCSEASFVTTLTEYLLGASSNRVPGIRGKKNPVSNLNGN